MSIRNKAIFSIHSNVVAIIGKSDARDKDENSVDLDEDKIKIETDRLQAEWDAQEYARNRRPEYPDIGDQLDDLYHKGAFSDEMAVKIKAVKDAHPKPE